MLSAVLSQRLQHLLGLSQDAAVLQAEAALAAQKRTEADAAAAAKAHEATVAAEKEHYSGLLQKARASQVCISVWSACCLSARSYGRGTAQAGYQ